VAAAQLDTSRATRVENNTAICIVVAGTESACELELKKRKSPRLVAKADNVNLCCRNNSITLSLTSRVRSDELTFKFEG